MPDGGGGGPRRYLDRDGRLAVFGEIIRPVVHDRGVVVGADIGSGGAIFFKVPLHPGQDIFGIHGDVRIPVVPGLFVEHPGGVADFVYRRPYAAIADVDELSATDHADIGPAGVGVLAYELDVVGLGGARHHTDIGARVDRVYRGVDLAGVRVAARYDIRDLAIGPAVAAIYDDPSLFQLFQFVFCLAHQGDVV